MRLAIIGTMLMLERGMEALYYRLEVNTILFMHSRATMPRKHSVPSAAPCFRFENLTVNPLMCVPTLSIDRHIY